jgi:spore coat protein U-like protein
MVRPLVWTLCHIGILLFPGAAMSYPACSITITSIAFGNIDVTTGSVVDTTATLTVTCSGGANGSDRLCVSIGAGSSGDSTSRKLNGPSGATLRYDLYSDSGRTTKWGSWNTGYDTSGQQVDAAKGATTNLTVYARIFGSQQTAAVGSYSSSFTGDPYLEYDDAGSSACPTGSQTASTSATATATVTGNCTVSASAMSFGTSSSPISANVDATGTITVLCSNGAAYSLGLDNGTNFSGSTRRMRLGATSNYVSYGLYTDTGRSLAWTTTTSTTSCTGGTNTCSLGTGTGANQTVTVYGRVPAQTPAVGSFTDTVVVTVTY